MQIRREIESFSIRKSVLAIIVKNVDVSSQILCHFTMIFSRSFASPIKKEMWMPLSKTSVLLGIEVSDPKLVPEYIDRINKSYLCSYLRIEDGYCIRMDKPEDPIKIPPTKTAEDACSWVGDHELPLSKSSTTIGYNDRHVVVSTTHRVVDGGGLVRLLNKIQEPNFTPVDLPPMIKLSPELLKDQMKYVDTNFSYFQPELMTRYKSQGNLPEESLTRPARINSFKDNVSNFAAYNKSTKKLKGMTEYLWTGLTLSMCAMKGQLGPIGCATCVDLRDKRTDILTNTNLYSIIWPCAPVSPKQTVEELGKLLRNDFILRKSRGDALVSFSGIDKGFSAPRDDSIAEISQLPPVHVRNPITDAFFSLLMHDFRNQTISLFGQSVVNDDTGSNIFTGRLRTAPSQVNDQDAKKILEGLHHYLVNIPKETTIEKAFEELKSFQNKF